MVRNHHSKTEGFGYHDEVKLRAYVQAIFTSSFDSFFINGKETCVAFTGTLQSALDDPALDSQSNTLSKLTGLQESPS